LGWIERLEQGTRIVEEDISHIFSCQTGLDNIIAIRATRSSFNDDLNIRILCHIGIDQGLILREIDLSIINKQRQCNCLLGY
jgi:hypothetical protein